MTDYLQWVGSMHYPTVNDFIDESQNLGVCKRIGRLPRDLEPGKSRIFLAHDEGLVGDGFIFGYYVVSRIEYLARNESDIPEALREHVEWVSDWYDEEFRGCGVRQEGMYLSTEADPNNVSEFVIFEDPRSLEAFDPGRTHCRGLLEIDYGPELIGTDNYDGDAYESATMIPPSQVLRDELTLVEDDELVERMQNGASMSRVAQEIAFESGQKKSAVMYRYLKLAGKVTLKKADNGS